MFIRTKRIKGKDYAYIVENSWQGKRVRQKVKEYIGRVHAAERMKSDEFFKFYSIQDVVAYVQKPREKVLADLARLELLNHGFEEKEKVFVNGDCIVDLNKISVRNKQGRNIAVAINEGFLSGFTLQRILDYHSDEDFYGKLLARLFIEAGIAVPKELFVAYFEKFYKEV